MPGIEMKYFVLKPRGLTEAARASRNAMLEYAKFIKDSDPELSAELTKWVEREVELIYGKE